MPTKKKQLKKEVKALLEEVKAADHDAGMMEASRDELLELLTLHTHQARITLATLELHLSKFGTFIDDGVRES